MIQNSVDTAHHSAYQLKMKFILSLFSGSSPYQRSVGIGKKLLLDWCQQELNQEFDPQSSLTYKYGLHLFF